MTKKEKGLTIQPPKNQHLTKEQAKFNRYIKEIERLNKKMQQTSTELDRLLAYYQTEIAPVLADRSGIRKEMVKTLFPYFKNKRKGFTRDEHDDLGAIIAEQLDMVLEEEEAPDNELKSIFKKVNGYAYEEELADELAFAKEEFTEYLRFHGFDVEDGAFDNAQSFEELEAAIGKKIDDQTAAHPDFAKEEEFHPGNTKHKKTSKQLKKELLEKEKASLKSRNISLIYKQLAKIFHPDLEPDISKKAGKELLMQELTAAYSQKDLHTLLKLELSWIHKEESNASSMADDKLKIYNEILKEQVKELKLQLESLKLQPQYISLMAINDFQDVNIHQLKDFANDFLYVNQELTDSLDILKQENAASIKEVKKIIEINREISAEEQLFDSLFDPFDDDDLEDEFDDEDLDNEPLFR